ncbi:hypothetical protein ACFQHO_47730 [Actinomadura yumaensis]|uniref:hypothetical protein n=1 Tax=Actinomadura yumaensis TaxID=111807 RepID=UPI00361CFBCF
MARAAKPRENKDKKARDLPTGIALLWGEQDQPARGPKPSLTPSASPKPPWPSPTPKGWRPSR